MTEQTALAILEELRLIRIAVTNPRQTAEAEMVGIQASVNSRLAGIEAGDGGAQGAHVASE